MNQADNPTENVTPNGTPRRWVKLMLWVSLSLNLLVFVAVGATLWRFSGGEGFHPPNRFTLGASELIRALPSDARHAMRRDLEPSEPREQRRERVMAWRSNLLAILRQDPFQPDALTDILEQNQQDIVVRVQQGQAALVAHIDAMSPSERSAYADSVENGMTRRRDRRRLRR